jgi:VIT1/CCC1 family predicted Fe2+/Mn2+ transporter
LQNANYTITSRETSEEAAHRHQKEVRDQLHRQKVEMLNWYVTVGLIAALGGIWTVVFFQSGKDDIQKLALAGLTSILTAWLGFIAGRSSGRPS